jgi:hypothetical protein
VSEDDPYLQRRVAARRTALLLSLVAMVIFIAFVGKAVLGSGALK